MADSPANEARPIAEISHGPTPFENFLEKNQKTLIVAGILIALATGAWVVMEGIKEGANLEAGAALAAADDIESLKAVSENHADTPAAASAAILLSDRQWDEGQQDAALDTLRSEIASHPDHPATLPARARLGARLAEQGRNDEASAAFEALLAQPGSGYLAPYALTALGQIAKAQGDLEKASDLFTRVTEDYPQNRLADAANQATRFLHFEMPEAIDPPQPPADETPEAGTPDGATSANDSATGGMSDAEQPADVTDLPSTGSDNPLLNSLNVAPVEEDSPAAEDSPPAPDAPETADPSPAENNQPPSGNSN